MKWFFGVLAGVVLIAVIGVVAYLAFNTNALVKTAIENSGSATLGVPVRVGGVDISIVQGSGTITALEVANPPGFAAGPALSIQSVHIALDATASTSTVIVLKQIKVAGARVQALVGSDGRTNFAAILDKLDSDDADGSASTGASMKLIVERFDFTNALATAVVPLVDKPLQLSIKDVHATDIGKREGGLSPEALGQALLQPIVAAVVKAVKKSGAAAAQKSLEDKLDPKLKGGLDLLRQLGHPAS